MTVNAHLSQLKNTKAYVIALPSGKEGLNVIKVIYHWSERTVFFENNKYQHLEKEARKTN